MRGEIQSDSMKLKPLIYLCEYQVKPEKAGEFESVIKDFVNEMKKYKMPYVFYMYSTKDFKYYAMNVFENLNSMSQWDADWREVESKIGPKTMDKYHEIEFGAIDYFKISLLRYRSNYSYLPFSPYFAKDKMSFVHWTFYYIEPSKRQKWAQFNKKWLNMQKNKNIKLPFLTFTGSIGLERPVWIYMRTAKSQVDYLKQREKNTCSNFQSLSEGMKGSVHMITRVKNVYSYYRPDLSYIPL